MRISDWSSYVCSSDLVLLRDITILQGCHFCLYALGCSGMTIDNLRVDTDRDGLDIDCCRDVKISNCTVNAHKDDAIVLKSSYRSEEHTSELQSLMRISYAVFCLKKKKKKTHSTNQ